MKTKEDISTIWQNVLAEHSLQYIDITNDSLCLLSFIVFLYDNEYAWKKCLRPSDSYLLDMIDHCNSVLRYFDIRWNRLFSTFVINTLVPNGESLIYYDRSNIDIENTINELSHLDSQDKIDDFISELKKIIDESGKSKILSIDVKPLFSVK